MVFIDINIFIDKIEFNIFEYEYEKKDILQDKIIVPKSFNIGDKLNYIRKFMVRLIKQYKIEKAYMNIEDDLGIEAINIVKMEGVLDELLSNCGVEKCI
ncbi:hypothetical protein [Faecalimicrobium dakarense]|uniref:hypothetical protein n=1 Tax=Faecalimicrobium dakarense TaxID=1301100 RepID=UPI0004BC2DAA|nr:hypothetical protein [[Clostridium] dakarense]